MASNQLSVPYNINFSPYLFNAMTNFYASQGSFGTCQVTIAFYVPFETFLYSDF